MAKNDGKLLRILDANFNRAKEGLRVCEDICRFLCDEPVLTRHYKDIRHHLAQAAGQVGAKKMMLARDVRGDVGRASSLSEFRRKTARDIFYANSQRVKESLRVLEEFLKLVKPKVGEELKRLRYAVYRVEQEAVKRF